MSVQLTTRANKNQGIPGKIGNSHGSAQPKSNNEHLFLEINVEARNDKPND